MRRLCRQSFLRVRRMIIEMESRHCLSCGRKMRVSTRSKQEFCSNFCIGEGPKWADQQKVLKDEKHTTESVSVDVGRLTESFEKAKKQRPNYAGNYLNKRTPKEVVKTITPTERNDSNNESDGENKTESENLLINEPGTQETKKESGNKSMKSAEQETRSLALQQPSSRPSEAISRSMSLIDESAMLLRDHMKSVASNPEDGALLATRLEKVNLACKCAGEIAKLIKVKVEAAKIYHSLTKHEDS